ncbi:TRAP transporter substrate-binding protein DctP [Halomonas sp. PR-M31]|uniref:TRAP transporter substrate-binding protein DctP n=1 Tax=Halomonas sp. PR-M31 TaxID=1471202 RepID=UPI0006521B7A|nr:TRAP transporter substrate-binding protein DctP [Halomonas sp. PR-M31]
MFRKIVTAAVIAAIGIFSSSAAVAEKWRFALEEGEGSVQEAYAQEFKKRIEKRSDGDISIDIYPYGALGTSPQLTELVRQNAIQLAFASPDHLASVIPEVGVFSLHYLFSDEEEFNEQVLASTKAQPLLQEAYGEQRLQLLSIISEGWTAWTANRAIKTPGDMEDLKMRTMTSPVVQETYRAYGAMPEPVIHAELRSALQSGQLEGQTNTISAIEEMSLYEVQNHLIQAKPLPFITTLVAAQDFFEQLPEEQQAMLNDVTDEMRRYIFDRQEELNQQRLEAIEENSDIEMITLTQEQRQAFREKSLPVRDVYVEQAGERGKKILETLSEELGVAQKKESDSSSGNNKD